MLSRPAILPGTWGITGITAMVTTCAWKKFSLQMVHSSTPKRILNILYLNEDKHHQFRDAFDSMIPSMSCGENAWLAPSFIQIPSVCVWSTIPVGGRVATKCLNPSFPFWPIEGHQWPSCSPMDSGLDTIIPWSRRPGSTAMSPFPQLSALRSCWVSAVSRGCPQKKLSKTCWTETNGKKQLKN